MQVQEIYSKYSMVLWKAVSQAAQGPWYRQRGQTSPSSSHWFQALPLRTPATNPDACRWSWNLSPSWQASVRVHPKLEPDVCYAASHYLCWCFLCHQMLGLAETILLLNKSGEVPWNHVQLHHRSSAKGIKKQDVITRRARRWISSAQWFQCNKCTKVCV